MRLTLHITALAAVLAGASASSSPPTGEWRDYAGDKAARRYAPLDQINATNVGTLQIAWRRPGLAPELAALDPSIKSVGYFKSTPLMIGGRLYAQDSVGLIEAFNPATGATIWVQERFAGDALRGQGMRGIAYVEVGGVGRLLAVRDKWLLAIDMSGHIIRDFGDNGRVDLSVAFGPRGHGSYMWFGAPQVCGGIVALGASMTDAPANKEEPPGVVQAFDVSTGKPRWVFNPIPAPSDPAAKTWENGSAAYTGEANTWAPMSSDEALGLLYLPTGSPTNDMYGGQRLGDNAYSDSLVAVNCSSGTVRWYHQLVHHDLWDLDLDSAPMLVDVSIGGRLRKLAVQLTKFGVAFVFDRVSGEPIWPITEQPVPKAVTPGERASPTQPRPLKPAPYEMQELSPATMIDLTPALHQEAINVSKGYLTGTIYTPPAVEGEDGVRGSLQPMTGGASWLGGAFDPEAGRLFVPSYTRTIWAGIVAGDPAATNLRYVRRHRTPMVGPQGLPLTKPPFGRITALDLKTGNTQWIVANGEGPRNHPALKGLNVPRLGYGTYVMPLATKTLLFGAQADKASYVGRTPDGTIPLADYFEDKLVAYNKNDGSVAGSIKLPAGAAGSILTYMYLGKQYIVVPTGSFQKPAEFVALSLP